MKRSLFFILGFLCLSLQLYAQDLANVEAINTLATAEVFNTAGKNTTNDASNLSDKGEGQTTYYSTVSPALMNTIQTILADSSGFNIADTTNLTLALLAVPTSPALTLLGIAPTTIAKPSDPKDFLVSITNAAQSLATLPTSFAMEFAPFMILKKDGLDLSEYLSNNVVDNIWQTFTLSFATNTIDSIPGISPAKTDIAVAAKFSILRGRIDNTAVQKLAKVDSLLALINKGTFSVTDSLLNTLPAYKAIVQSIDTLVAQSARNPSIRDSETFKTAITGLNAKLDSFNNSQTFAMQSFASFYSQQLNQLSAEVSGLTFNRVGFMLDAAAGVVYEFPFQEFDSSAVASAGAWLTGSQIITLKGKQIRTLTLQGYSRLLYNPNQMTVSPTTGQLITEDVLDFDIGAKIDFTSGTNLTLSLEYIRRFVLNSDAFDPTYQFAFNGSYQVAPNYQVSITFGRNFDGTAVEGGNLLAALHLFGTFGRRKVNTSVANF